MKSTTMQPAEIAQAQLAIATGLTQEVIAKLSRFRDITVMTMDVRNGHDSCIPLRSA